MGMNSQLHLILPTKDLDYLRKEAEKLDISVSEVIRRKITRPPTEKEVILLRELKEIFRSEK